VKLFFLFSTWCRGLFLSIHLELAVSFLALGSHKFTQHGSISRKIFRRTLVSCMCVHMYACAIFVVCAYDTLVYIVCEWGAKVGDKVRGESSVFKYIWNEKDLLG
jgi:hypothetical protein